MAAKKTKLKKDNIKIFVVGLILIGLFITLGIMIKNTLSFKNGDTKEIKVVDKMDDYGYYLTDTDTDYYKKLYNELKDTLNSDNLDEDKYASLISQLFVTDFYDLNSKLSKADIGGIQFIKSEYKDIFTKTASDINGIYYYVKSDLYNERKQELPSVEKTEVVSVKNEAYKYGKINDDNSYIVVINITYKKDLGYQKTATIKLVHNDKLLEIVEIS